MAPRGFRLEHNEWKLTRYVCVVLAILTEGETLTVRVLLQAADRIFAYHFSFKSFNSSTIIRICI